MENIEFITMASVAVVFLVNALKMLLAHFEIKIRSQILVGAVCALISIVYAAIVAFAPIDVLSTIAQVGSGAFLLSQALYKFYEDGNKTTKNAPQTSKKKT